jgi:hypothetical protein
VAELEAELARERQDNKSNLELVVQVETLRARVAELVEALSHLIPRFEGACATYGNDEEYIKAATERYRSALRSATETKDELPSVK